jgi:hypothetical protein
LRRFRLEGQVAGFETPDGLFLDFKDRLEQSLFGRHPLRVRSLPAPKDLGNPKTNGRDDIKNKNSNNRPAHDLGLMSAYLFQGKEKSAGSIIRA